MTEFPDFDIDPIEKLKMDREFEKLDLQAAEGADDDFLLWRTKLNIALAREGVSALWHDDYEYMTLQPIGHPEDMERFIHVPKAHIEDLFFQNANPSGTACYLRAILYDQRFKLWVQEEENE